MNYYNTVVGMDVHKDSIAVAVLPSDSEDVKQTLVIENTPKAMKKLVKKLALEGSLEFVYEAGPCGYEVQRQITALGYRCSVIAPSLTPVRPGDRVKTDRRDAKKLARFFRAGELTLIHVPTRAQEFDRDLIRAREDALTDRLRARQRLGHFLLRHGLVYRQTTSWGVAHRAWLRSLKFEKSAKETFETYIRSMEEAEERLKLLGQHLEDLAKHQTYRGSVRLLRCLKGIDTLSALTLILEIQEFGRFSKARAMMGFTGMVASENTSSFNPNRGRTTRMGNRHIRRILIEAAWNYRRNGLAGMALAERRKGCPEDVVRIGKRAQRRLHRKFVRMLGRNKPNKKAAVAVARELSGFVWAISRHFPAVTAA